MYDTINEKFIYSVEIFYAFLANIALSACLYDNCCGQPIHVGRLLSIAHPVTHAPSVSRTSKSFLYFLKTSRLHVCLTSSRLVMVMVMVFIYRVFYLHFQMRFILLQCKSEIRHQRMSISDLIQPTQFMKS